MKTGPVVVHVGNDGAARYAAAVRQERTVGGVQTYLEPVRHAVPEHALGVIRRVDHLDAHAVLPAAGRERAGIVPVGSPVLDIRVGDGERHVRRLVLDAVPELHIGIVDPRAIIDGEEMTPGEYIGTIPQDELLHLAVLLLITKRVVRHDEILVLVVGQRLVLRTQRKREQRDGRGAELAASRNGKHTQHDRHVRGKPCQDSAGRREIRKRTDCNRMISPGCERRTLVGCIPDGIDLRGAVALRDTCRNRRGIVREHSSRLTENDIGRGRRIEAERRVRLVDDLKFYLVRKLLRRKHRVVHAEVASGGKTSGIDIRAGTGHRDLRRRTWGKIDV